MIKIPLVVLVSILLWVSGCDVHQYRYTIYFGRTSCNTDAYQKEGDWLIFNDAAEGPTKITGAYTIKVNN